MSGHVVFQDVYPIGDTDTNALLAKEIGPAIAYYTRVLGFALVSEEEDRAVLRRDNVRIGLARNGKDPEQASCYFAVSDVEALRRDLDARDAEPSALRLDDHAGKAYRIFFAREPFGVCFCFGQPA